MIIIYHDEIGTVTVEAIKSATETLGQNMAVAYSHALECTSDTMPLSYFAQPLPPLELIPRTSWQKDAFGKISECMMRGIHEYRLSLLNCFRMAARILATHYRPRRMLTIGTRYRMCSTRVI